MSDQRVGTPRSEMAEFNILGVFLNNGSLVSVSKLVPDDFYSERHRSIFFAIKKVSDSGDTPDIVNVAEMLRREKLLELSGGEVNLMDLADSAVSKAGWESSEKIIKDKALLRHMLERVREANERIFDDAEDPNALLSELQSAFNSIRGDVKSSTTSFNNVIDDFMNNPGRIHERTIATGLEFIDSRIRILPQQLGIIAGRPGEGKTALATQIAAGVASYTPTLFCTLEMSPEELGLRIISQASGIPTFALEDPENRMTREQIERVSALKDSFDIEFCENTTVEDLRATALSHKAKRRELKLIVVDYLQLMTVKRPSGNRVQDVSEISRGLKLLAKELDVTIIALSQFAREAAKGPPQLHHLRESGSIEQDADWVLFVYKDDEDFNARNMEVPKQRRGPRCEKFPVAWRGDTVSFSNAIERM
jgi:replicative DNA helicase